MQIAVIGAAGRMGRQLVAAVLENPQAQLSGALEHAQHQAQGQDAGILVGQAACGITVSADTEAVIKASDAIIDFTQPEVTMANLALCRQHNTALVIGTTGFSAEQEAELQAGAQDIGIVKAPNMSVGVNLCFKLLRDMAQALGDGYDVEIVEMHHNQKKDAPSGTAMRMGEVVAEGLERNFHEVANFHREGFTGARDPQEIGMQTVRGGDIVGEHTVYFIGPDERIELSHRAASRTMFGRGAVRAALWLQQQPAGLYDMQDVLGLT